MVLGIEEIKRLSKLDYPITLNSYQFRLLGIGWPPRRGWIVELMGRIIDEKLYTLLLSLKGTEKRDRKALLRKSGINPSKLFHKKLGRVRLL